MIFPGTNLLVSDNSGGQVVRCLRVLGRTGYSAGTVGDLIVVSVKELRKRGNIKVKRKEVCLGLITTVKKVRSRSDGRFFQCSKNTCILLNYKKTAYGTRIFGPLLKEFKKQKQYKLLSLSSSFF
jgi:large subunit ribosomal protein L14